MDRSLLDTDIFSEVLKGVDTQVAARAMTYHAIFGRYTISTISVLEIVKGLHKVQRDDRVREFLNELDSVDILTLDVPGAELAGRIYGDLERTGQPIGRADPIIAAIAIQHGLVLITGNQAHYERIQELGYNLLLDNWRLS